MANGKSNKNKAPATSSVGAKKFPAPGGGLNFFSRQSGKTLLLCLLLFGAVVWVFWPALNGDFMFFDDSPYVFNNAHVNGGLTWNNVAWAFYSLDNSNWHPLTWLSHMLDCQLYGLKPYGHHLTNVLLHALNAVLVFLVFRKMTGATWRSLAVAALFGLHPLRVESVAWISERKDVLSTMFWMLTLWAYARFADESRGQSHKTKFFYGLSLFFFILGLMSKTMLVTLPGVLLLLDFWPLDRWRLISKWRLLAEKVPFFLLALVVSKIAYVAQQRGGMTQELAGLPLADRVGNALISYCRYIGKFFWPVDLCVFYPHPGHWPTGEVLLAGLFLLGVSIFALAMWRRMPYLPVGWFWYLGTLVPVIGLVQLSSQSMADRYTYVPMIGVTVLLVWGLYDVTKRWRHQAVILSAFAAIAMIACVVRTRQEIPYWKDGVTLWKRAIAVTQNNYTAHTNLGVLLWSTDRDAALAEFQEAVRLNPDFAPAQRYLADELLGRRRFDEAIIHLKKALEINPNYGLAQFKLGYALLNKGQADEAVVHLQKSIQLEPNNPQFLNLLCLALLNSGQFDEAIPLLQKLSSLLPDNPAPVNALGIALLKKGQTADAIGKFQEALKLNPDFSPAKSNLVWTLNFEEQSAKQNNQPVGTNSANAH